MTNIWVPKFKIVSSRGIETDGAATAGVSGRYTITGSLPDGRTRKIAEFPNMITDNGLERWGVGTITSYCSLGSGNSTPTHADSSLASHLASKTAGIPTYSTITTSPRYTQAVIPYVFPPPGTDKVVREVGVGWASGGGSLWSRSLTTDPGGAPLDISWLANETLTVNYELRRYIPEVDMPYSEAVGGTTYTGLIRAYGTSNANGEWAIPLTAVPTPGKIFLYDGALGTLTGVVTGSSIESDSATAVPYENGSYERGGIITFNPIPHELSGVSVVLLYGLSGYRGFGTYQKSVSPTINKALNYTLEMTMFTYKWGRYSG